MPLKPIRPPVIAILNLKGGVGKTHTSWLLASVAQERSARILLVDLDTQANLTRSFVESVESQHSVAELFNPAADAAAADIVHHTKPKHREVSPRNS